MFTVILKNGKVFVFTVKACADLYVQAFGGVIVGAEQAVNEVEEVI